MRYKWVVKHGSALFCCFIYLSKHLLSAYAVPGYLSTKDRSLLLRFKIVLEISVKVGYLYTVVIITIETWVASALRAQKKVSQVAILVSQQRLVWIGEVLRGTRI